MCIIGWVEGVFYRQGLRNNAIEDKRLWIQNMPHNDLLEAYHIHHLGKVHARQSYHIVRPNLEGLFFLSTCEGEGEVLIDGQWRTVGLGQACVLPPFSPHALRIKDGDESKVWKFNYVRYYYPKEVYSPVTCSSAFVADCVSDSFAAAMQGFLEEGGEPERERYAMPWLQLIVLYVEDFIKPMQQEDCLHALWLKVSQNLHQPWTLQDLAAYIGMSTEHTRRLCLRVTGKSPMRYLTWLRMQKAVELLLTSEYKIAAIAAEVGYHDAAAFTNAFKRVMGCPPSHFLQSSTTK